jgi:midasin (ATPase involved in ribosome maturation)
VIEYIKRMLYKELSSTKLTDEIEIDKLRVDKGEQNRYRQQLTEELGEVQMSLVLPIQPQSEEQNDLVNTSYLNEKSELVENEMQTHLFRHLAVVGNEGSGKMSFVRMVAKEQEFIVVTLEETFDSKNLVGTYVCNETGEFEFKKGPLTVAAEKGLWLVLRNIDKSPPDLLSFLLPLVQENRL